MEEKQYYVYALLDTRKPGPFIYEGVDFTFDFEPFYIGKGTGNRCNRHFKDFPGHNPHKENKIKKLQLLDFPMLSVKLFFSTSSDAAYIEEAKVIQAIGRQSTGGILTNYHAGGEGGTSPTEEIKRKISATLMGRVIPPEQLAKMRQYWSTRPGIMKGRKGVLHPCYGRVGALSPQFGRCGELSPTFGRARPEDELERMRYNKITSYLVVLDTFTNEKFNVYNTTEFTRLHGVPISSALADTLEGVKTIHYYGLRAVERVELPVRWFDSEELLKEYYQSLTYIIPGFAQRDTKDLHKKYMKMSAINNVYTIQKDDLMCKVYDVTSFCKANNLDRATLYRTLPGYTRYQKHHHGYTIVTSTPLQKGWFNDPSLLSEFDEETKNYQQAA